MTNAQIIFNEQLRLMDEGLLGTTGRELSFELEDGSTKTVPEPLPIHTYSVWQELGYQVKRGQKALTSFQIWKHRPAGKRKDKNSGQEVEVSEKLFLTTASFFSSDQVELGKEVI